jgi:hypothetical protein
MPIQVTQESADAVALEQEEDHVTLVGRGLRAVSCDEGLSEIKLSSHLLGGNALV